MAVVLRQRERQRFDNDEYAASSTDDDYNYSDTDIRSNNNERQYTFRSRSMASFRSRRQPWVDDSDMRSVRSGSSASAKLKAAGIKLTARQETVIDAISSRASASFKSGKRTLSAARSVLTGQSRINLNPFKPTYDNVTPDEIEQLVKKCFLGTPKEQQKAAQVIAAVVLDENKIQMFIEKGGLEALFSLLRSLDVKVQRYATTAVAHLTIDNEEVRAKIVSQDALIRLLLLMDSHDNKVKSNTVLALSNVALNDRAVDVMLGEHQILHKVIDVMKSRNDSIRRNAARLVAFFALKDKYQNHIFESGLVAQLVAFLKLKDHFIHIESCRALANLTRNAEMASRVLNTYEGLIDMVIEVARGVNGFAQGQAARALANFAQVEKFKLYIMDSALIPLLNLVQFGNDEVISFAIRGISNLSDSARSRMPEDAATQEIEEQHWRYVLNDQFKEVCNAILADEQFRPFFDCSKPVEDLEYYDSLGYVPVQPELDIRILKERSEKNYYTGLESFQQDIYSIVSPFLSIRAMDDPMNLRIKAKKLILVVDSAMKDIKRNAGDELLRILNEYSERMLMRKEIGIIRNAMVDKGAVYLVNLLKDIHEDIRYEAIRAIANMVITVQNQIAFTDGIDVELYVSCLEDKIRGVVQEAARAIGNMANLEQNKQIFADSDVVRCLIKALSIEDNNVKKWVARALCILSDHEGLNEQIGRADGASLAVTIKLLGDQAVGIEATKLIANLALHEANREKVLAGNVLMALSSSLGDSNKHLQYHAARAIVYAIKDVESDEKRNKVADMMLRRLLELASGGIGKIIQHPEGCQYCEEPFNIYRFSLLAIAHLTESTYVKKQFIHMEGFVPLKNLLQTTNDIALKRYGIAVARNLAFDEASCTLLASNGFIELIAANLPSPDTEVQYQSAAALANLATTDKNRGSIFEQTFPTFLRILNSDNEVAQSETSRAIANMALNSDIRDQIVEMNTIGVLIGLLSHPNEDIHCNALIALKHIALTSDYQRLISQQGGIPPIICLSRSENVFVLREVVATLANLALHDINKRLIVDAGGMPPLIEMVRSTDAEIQRYAALTLSYLAMDEVNQVIISDEGGIRPLIALLKSPDIDIVMKAATCIYHLAGNTNNQYEIYKNGAADVLQKFTKRKNNQLNILALDVICKLARNDVVKTSLISNNNFSPLIVMSESSNPESKRHASAMILDIMKKVSSWDPFVAQGGLQGVLALLKPQEGVKQDNITVTNAISALALIAANDAYHDAIISGDLSHIIQCLRSPILGIRCNGVSLIAKLANKVENRHQISSSCLDELLSLTNDSNIEVKAHALCALANLAADAHIRNNISSKGQAYFDNIVRCLELPTTKKGSHDEWLIWEAARLVSNLAVNEKDRISLYEKGCTDLLIQLLKYDNISVQAEAVKAVSVFAQTDTISRHLAERGVIEILHPTLLDHPVRSINLYAIQCIAVLMADADNRARFNERKGFHYIMKFIRTKDIDMIYEATRIFSEMARSAPLRDTLIEIGVLEKLIAFLRLKNRGIQTWSLKALCNISINDNCKKLIVSLKGVPSLLAMTRFDNPQTQKEAIKTLANLSTIEDNCIEIVNSGGLGYLIPRLVSSNVDIQTDISRAIFNLCKNSKIRGLILEEQSWFRVLFDCQRGNSCDLLVQYWAVKSIILFARTDEDKELIFSVAGWELIISWGYSSYTEVKTFAINLISVLLTTDQRMESFAAVSGLSLIHHLCEHSDNQIALLAIDTLHRLCQNPRISALYHDSKEQSVVLLELYARLRDAKDARKIIGLLRTLEHLARNALFQKCIIGDSDFVHAFLDTIIGHRDNILLRDPEYIRLSFMILSNLVDTEEFFDVLSAAENVKILIEYLVYDDIDVQTSCMAMLAYLSFNDDIKHLVIKEQIIAPTVKLIDAFKKEETIAYACGLVANVAEFYELGIKFAKGGLIPPLCKAAERAVTCSLEVQKAVVRAFVNISACAGCGNAIGEHAGSKVLVRLLALATDQELLINLTRALSNLSMDDVNKKDMIEENCIQILLKLTKSTTNEEILEHASMTIAHLSKDDAMPTRIEEHGGIHTVVKLLKVKKTLVRKLMCRTLKNLAAQGDNVLKILEQVGLEVICELCSSEERDVFIPATEILTNIILTTDAYNEDIVKYNGMEFLIRLTRATIESKTNSVCKTLRAIANLLRYDTAKKSFARSKGFDLLVRITKEFAIADAHNMECCRCIAEVTTLDLYHAPILDTGLHKHLISCLKTNSVELLSLICAAIANIVSNDSCCGDMIEHGILPYLIHYVGLPEEPGQEPQLQIQCARALSYIVLYADMVDREIVEAGGVDKLLTLSKEAKHAQLRQYASLTLKSMGSKAYTPAYACIAYGDGLAGGVAGQIKTFTIQAKDNFDANRTTGGDCFNVSFERMNDNNDNDNDNDGPLFHSSSISSIKVFNNDPTAAQYFRSRHPYSSFVSTNDNGDGTYTVTYRICEAATYILKITKDDDGKPISGSPFFISITPDIIHGPSCVVIEGDQHLARSTVCVENHIVIESRDQFSNRLTTGGNLITISMALKDEAQQQQQVFYDENHNAIQVDANGSVPKSLMRAEIEDLHDGTYRAKYFTLISGSYEIEIMVTPKEVLRYQNNKNKHHHHHHHHELFKPEHVAGSPFALEVSPAKPSHITSIFHHHAHGKKFITSPSVPLHCSIEVRDQFNNHIRNGGGGANLRVSLVNTQRGTSIDIPITYDAAEALYKMEVITKEAGEHAAFAYLDDQPISNCPATLQILTGAPAPGNFVAAGVSLQKTVVGLVGKFVVKARDSHDNLLSSLSATSNNNNNNGIMELNNNNNNKDRYEDFMPSVTLYHVSTGQLACVGTVIYNGNGTYTVNYQLGQVGAYHLHVLVQGKHIVGSPFLVHCTAYNNEHMISGARGGHPHPHTPPPPPPRSPPNHNNKPHVMGEQLQRRARSPPM